ncbi:hypothetical protein [uncultured Pelagimonas sp.]|uniref:DUF7220 family protein n=1 Tax=uncultured Pelagimonas sp. TaxID=1618102 RepID=UPI002620228C|nr:hypothetical protein [uncultured Pelagimonas sp.]
MSFIEALTNSTIGLCVAVLLTLYALPFWGYEPSVVESFEITALFFVAGFIRNWTIRAVFHRYVNRGGQAK